MEKLIELLNEYAHTYADHYDDTGGEIEIRFIRHTDQCFTYECEGKAKTLVDDVIISKRYGFIKWLVENEKIDVKELEKADRPFDVGYATEETLYERVLMLLSIQDNPIEFLVSILK